MTWISSIASQIMDAVSGLFLNALGTDMVTMEEYFPFITKAFDVMQYTAWAVLFLIVVWQLFRAFGGPITEAENPWQLVVRGAIFALLIGYAKPIFMLALDIARAPYTALMDVSMTAEEFTFAGVEQVLSNGLLTIVSTVTVVGPILVLILLIALGWNYFKLLLEAVERYIVVGVLCYTSPLAFCMGGSKATNQVFKSWCRMVGSQLLLLVMNVWFIRGFNSSAGQYIGNGGALSTGQGSIFLWLFCALAFLKTAQKFDSYMAAMGLNVAQTGSSMGMELLMAARVISGVGHSAKSAGSVFGRGGSTATGTGAAASGFASGFASRFKGNSYVRDAVVDGGTRMGMGGGVGFVGRVFGGVAARNGAMLMGESIASVAARPAEAAGTIAGDIADRSLGNYMPQLAGHTLKGTQISGGHISTTATGTDGKVSSVEMFNTAQFEKPAAPHSVVTATDGSTWYQMASGEGRNAFYDAPGFTGSPAESEQVAAAFPGAAEGTVLRNTGDGIMEAGSESGNSLWYNSAYYNEPEAPHTVMQAANGVDWYAMQQHAEAPAFEQGEAADTYNQAAFRNFMPGFEQQVAHVDGTHREDGHFEVRHADGSGTAFYDTARFAAPRGDYQVYEDVRGQQWIAIHGDPAVERKPVFEDGKPVYDGENVRTVSVESVRYKNMPSRFKEPEKRPDIQKMANALKMTLYGTLGNGQMVPLTDAELIAFVNAQSCSPMRKHILTTALSLVGKVPYFWGGKSAPGWNDAWNTPRLVTSAGSPTTGTIRPFGLDCSGFTTWVFNTAVGVEIGAGCNGQYPNTYGISAAELLPGDLGFLADDDGWGHVEDRGGSGIENNIHRVDIYVPDHQQALRMGRYTTTATIYRLGR